jgi:hypothetical protein
MLEEFDKIYIKIPEKNIFFEAYYFLEYKNNKNYYFIIHSTSRTFWLNPYDNDNSHSYTIHIKAVNKKYVSKSFQKEIILEKNNRFLFLNGKKIQTKNLGLLKSIYTESMQDIIFHYYMIKDPNLYEKSKYFLRKKMKKILHFIKFFR